MNSKVLKIAITVLAVALFAISSNTALAESEKGPFIVMVGTPAAGKSASSEMLSEKYGIPWVNVREELLKVVTEEAKKGGNVYAHQGGAKRGAASAKRRRAMKEAVAALEAGELVSDDSLNALVAASILASDAAGGFILDGYPMTVAQAEFLDSMLELRQMTPMTVIYLNVSDEVALQRMKERGRADDKSGFGEQRIENFRAMIGPLVEYYGEDAVNEIDGTMSKSEIAAVISRAVED